MLLEINLVPPACQLSFPAPVKTCLAYLFPQKSLMRRYLKEEGILLNCQDEAGFAYPGTGSHNPE